MVEQDELIKKNCKPRMARRDKRMLTQFATFVREKFPNLRSVAELLHFIQSGNPVTYTFFWKHLPEKHGEISNCCLSNWYATSFTIDDTTYRSTE